MRFLDVTEVKLDDPELQTTADRKDVIKHELESLGKILRIQNVPFDKDEVVYTFLADFLAPLLKITPHEFILETDHTYRQHTQLTPGRTNCCRRFL